MRKKTALITGANRGIGKEIAKQLDALGFKVIVTSRDLEKAKKVASELGKDVMAVSLDVANEKSVAAAAATVSEQIDYLDVLVNNAGIIGNRAMLDFDIPQIDDVMATNFRGPILTSKYFMNMLERSEGAVIINLSSGMGELESLESGGYAAYRLSKTALNAFTILLAGELDSRSIKVFSVCPGWVKTDMGGKGASLEVQQGADTAVWLATTAKGISGRFYRNRKMIKW